MYCYLIGWQVSTCAVCLSIIVCLSFRLVQTKFFEFELIHFLRACFYRKFALNFLCGLIQSYAQRKPIARKNNSKALNGFFFASSLRNFSFCVRGIVDMSHVGVVTMTHYNIRHTIESLSARRRRRRRRRWAHKLKWKTSSLTQKDRLYRSSRSKSDWIQYEIGGKLVHIDAVSSTYCFAKIVRAVPDDEAECSRVCFCVLQYAVWHCAGEHTHTHISLFIYFLVHTFIFDGNILTRLRCRRCHRMRIREMAKITTFIPWCVLFTRTILNYDWIYP